MTEKEITLCGHGSGTPSLKNMADYLSNRQGQTAPNGKTKGLVCVVRFLKTDDQRAKFHDLYKTILGRNIYSQNWRQYVYTPRSDGRYYSDCSSSGCYTYDQCGINGVKSYNTAAMYYGGEKVDVKIENGHVEMADLGKLRVGDALLFRGSDPSRPLQIGHVEYIYEMPTDGVWANLPDGSWTYTAAGELVKGWKTVNHHWYYFDNSGIMQKGWQKINNEWFYLEESGDYEGACWHEADKRNGSLERWYVD